MADAPPDNKTPKDRGGFWDQPVVRRAAPSESYTKIIRGLRITLPLVAAGVVGLLMAWPRVEQTMAPLKDAAAQQQAVGKNELLNPAFKSLDSNNQPYTISAARAIQSIGNTDIVLLEKPKAFINLNSGHVVDAAAEHGTYTQSEGKLLLEGTVTLHEDEGYVFTTSKAVLNVKTHQGWSDQPVEGHGPAGTINASGVQVHGDDQVIVFTGPAKMRLNHVEGM